MSAWVKSQWQKCGTVKFAAKALPLVGVAGVLLWGCNLFAPLASDNTSDLDYDGLVLRGSEAVNDSDFATALRLFEKAKAKYPAGSEAHLFHAKAIMALYKLDYNRLNGEFENKRGDSSRGLPFIDSTDDVASVDSVYHPIYEAVQDLNHILRGPTDTLRFNARVFLLPDGDTAGDGRVGPAVAQLDLGLLQTLNGMLGPLDLDSNGHVDSACGARLCAGLSGSCLQSVSYVAVCKDGPLSEVKRLVSYKALTSNINLKNLDTKDMKTRDVSTNPNDINAFLDAMEGPLAGANYNLDSVSSSLTTHHEDNLNNQLSNVVGNVRDMQYFLSYMRFNDHVDNDYDAQTGLGTPTGITVWHDFNKDGGIRWNYEDSLLPTGFTNEGLNIGHPLHRYFHPELYLTFTDYNKSHPLQNADTSVNSRTALMKKHCHKIMEQLPPAGEFTPEIRDSVARLCDEITPVLKPTAKPPLRSDWVSGPFGVDEEMVDERDNDYDGIRDEDGRNARGLDDDDDALLTVDMIGTTVAPMVWKEDGEHQNTCPDIDITVPMKAPPMQREFCVGSLEHRIYLARNGGKDSLFAYYSPFLSESANDNCLEDYAKLPQAYKDAFKPTEAEYTLACRYKHIWTAPIPPHSEWTSGLFGIDEEKADGFDNDGDGWIDEDLQ
jgi:hypothetical protein